VHVPCSMTPVGPSGQAITTFGFCLPLGERRRLPRLDAFEAQSHGPGTPCLRFAESVTLPHARLGSGCWPALPGGACFLPAGFHCKVSGCLCHPSSSPRLGLAHSPFITVHPRLNLLRVPINHQDLGHLGVEFGVAPLQVILDLVRPKFGAGEQLGDGAPPEHGQAGMPGFRSVFSGVERQGPGCPELFGVAQVEGLRTGDSPWEPGRARSH